MSYESAPPPPSAVPHRLTHAYPAYSSWPKRVGGALIDALASVVASIPFYIGYGMFALSIETTTDASGNVTSTDMSDVSPLSVALMAIGLVILMAFAIWNVCIKQGRTGYSIGKGVVGIQLISQSTGQPIGAGMSFLRQIVHIVDSLPCYLGWLWPLWDERRQTFADKIMSTVVIDRPRDQAT